MTATGTLTKNQIAVADAWLLLVLIDATAIGGSTYRRTSDESTTNWNSQSFDPATVSFGDMQENLQGGLPRIDMKISNLDAMLNPAINAYDGLRGATVTVYIVPSGNLAANTAELTEVFEVIETSADNQWITFTLGYADPLGRRFPRDRYTATACRHAYKGAFCRLSATHLLYGTDCDHTLTHCQARGNEAQFGGSPGVDEGIYQ
jgi:phage-related protein